MSKELEIFKNDEFGSVRAVVIDDEPWFIGKDVAEALGYADGFGALKKHVDDDDKQNCQNSSFESPRGMTIINESGMYSLIISSKLPTAKKFKHWVTSEVLPSIRKNGGYISNQENMTPEQIVANALVVANNIIEAKNKELGQAHAKIKEDAPKVEFYNAVTESKDAIDIASVAKTLNFKGIGRNKLFEILRDNKVLQHNNQPYQRYIDRGYFRIIEQKFVKPTGDICINLKTVVYQQGVEFIRNLVKNL